MNPTHEGEKPPFGWQHDPLESFREPAFPRGFRSESYVSRLEQSELSVYRTL